MVQRTIIILASIAIFAVSAQRFKIDRHNLPKSNLVTRSEVSGRNFDSLRLPNSSVPTHYNLFLDTNIHRGDSEYSGNVQISIKILENTKQIVLHSVGNSIPQVELYDSNQLKIPLVNFELDVEKEFLVVNTLSTLLSGSNYRLAISFAGTLRTDNTGFHRLAYQAEDGSTTNIAATQFEPSSARKAFPCFDEPAIRATFDIRITCGLNYKVTSNMPAAGVTIQQNEKKLTQFKPTPRMPTYLVAFTVTDFISQRMVLKEPTTLTMEVLARSAVRNQLDLGLRKGAEAIRAMEKHFDQIYHLPKLDQIALMQKPGGAMENWGLVTYDDRYLLVNEETASNYQKEEVIITIVHEFVHQFFGNLVTPKWWTDLFLNEGFATFYEYYVGAEVEPSIRFKELFAVEALQLALSVDSKNTSRPLSFYTETNLDSLFDVITYKKGGSVLRMMNHALGERTFQKGIRRYLASNKDSAVDPNDLFDSLESAAKEDAMLPLSTSVGTVMSNWIYEDGYPLVTVELVPDSNEVVFRQDHFSERELSSHRTWWIPISYRLSTQTARDETETKFWMPQGASQVSVRIDVPEDAYLLVNPHQTGYYRVNYDNELWRRIIQQLNADHEAIPAVSRAQLLDDALKLAKARRIWPETAFEVYKYLANEVDYVPWYAAFASDNLQYINDGLVVEPTAYRAFQFFVEKITHKLFVEMGFNELVNEPHEHQRLRAMVIEWSCRMGSIICRFGSNQLMQANMDGVQTLPPYIKHSVYCGGMMEATQAQFQALFQIYQQSGDPAERAMYISALGCNENYEFLSAYMTVTLGTGQEVRLLPNEWLLILQSVYSRTNKGLDAFRAWMQTHINDVVRVLSPRQEFNDIIADYSARNGYFDNFKPLVDLLKDFADN
ncbi:aminopeptidase Ey-like [Culex quinquefasciatus]|uniref:aminopeptidase Ey-like n=1 Tax=Culex quinquefasciatus TaxID=7176 RepID=UPI0018E354C8|nr:aminopeptidase Ey-like [Culex quinquefasciatus]